MTFFLRRDTRSVSSKIVPLLLFTLLVSCGPDPLVGRVVLSGSATLSPLATKTAEAWTKAHPRVETRVEAIGSDAGLERLVRYRDADLALLSRPVTEEDRTAAAEKGQTLVVLPVARDGVSIVVPVANTWAQSLTRDQAARAFSSARRWSDLDPRWPDTPLHRFVLGPNSGTADVFANQILGGQKALLYTGTEVQASEDDRIVARGVAQVDGAIGFLGWGTLQDVGPTLRPVAFEGVLPTLETIQDQSYGLPRTLWLVATEQGLQDNPAALGLVRSLYENYTELTTGMGLVGLTDLERSVVLSKLP
jgi:phosphate transport system substrate-binding protein